MLSAYAAERRQRAGARQMQADVELTCVEPVPVIGSR